MEPQPPLQVYTVPARPAPPPLRATPGLLAAFLHPLPVPAFLAATHTASAAALQRGGAARLAPLLRLLHGGRLPELLADSPSDTISAWLRSPSGALRTLRFAEPASALAAHACGASLYFRAPQRAAEALVPALCEGLGVPPCAAFHDAARQGEPRGEVEVFASRAGHATDWHTDFQSNFTVQLSGRKTWRFAHGGIASPLRAHTPHYATGGSVVEEQCGAAALAWRGGGGGGGALPPAFAPPPAFFAGAPAVTLSAGDCLYFPAGLWHRVECDEDSLSINVSLVGLSWADVAAGAVRHCLWRQEGMRRMLSVPWGGAPGGAPALALPQAQPLGASSGRRGGGAGGRGSGGSARAPAAAAAAAAAGARAAAPAREAAALAQAQAALEALRAAVGALRAEDLLAPCDLASRRRGRSGQLPPWQCRGKGGGEGEEEEGEEGEEEEGEEEEGEEGEEEDEDEEEEEDDDEEQASTEAWERERGFYVRFQRDGTQHVHVLPAAAAPAPAPPSQAFRRNPLSIILDHSCSLDYDGPASSSSSSSSSSGGGAGAAALAGSKRARSAALRAAAAAPARYTLLRNLGAPTTGEDLAPLSRLRLTLHGGAQGQRAVLEAGRRGGALPPPTPATAHVFAALAYAGAGAWC